jgi:hypothetical protein
MVLTSAREYVKPPGRGRPHAHRGARVAHQADARREAAEFQRARQLDTVRAARDRQRRFFNGRRGDFEEDARHVSSK